MNEPFPPRGTETDVILGCHNHLQAGGMALEQSNWLVGVGVALIGAVVGVIYALQHTLPG